MSTGSMDSWVGRVRWRVTRMCSVGEKFLLECFHTLQKYSFFGVMIKTSMARRKLTKKADKQSANSHCFFCTLCNLSTSSLHKSWDISTSSSFILPSFHLNALVTRMRSLKRKQHIGFFTVRPVWILYVIVYGVGRADDYQLEISKTQRTQISQALVIHHSQCHHSCNSKIPALKLI